MTLQRVLTGRHCLAIGRHAHRLLLSGARLVSFTRFVNELRVSTEASSELVEEPLELRPAALLLSRAQQAQSAKIERVAAIVGARVLALQLDFFAAAAAAGLAATVALRRIYAQGRVNTAQNHSAVPLLRALMQRGSEAVGRHTYFLLFLRQLLSPRALPPLQLHSCGCTHSRSCVYSYLRIALPRREWRCSADACSR